MAETPGRKTEYPRLLLAAGASGSGKTLIMCGLLAALRARGLRAAAFKCGPDYIDPLFHEKILHTRSRNLDTYLAGADMTRYLFLKNAAGADISVMEGVMGYYDGLGGTEDTASAYDLARVTKTPAVLIVNAKGMSSSALAYVKGFLTYRADSRIRGVILNQTTEGMYRLLAPRIEKELGVRAFGYVPKTEDCVIESRHLGLVLPDEVRQLEEKMRKLGGILEETLDIDGLLHLARQAEALPDEDDPRTAAPRELSFLFDTARVQAVRGAAPVLAVARDEAFCFLYEDNLNLLRELGVRIREFSPLKDPRLPEEADGLLLCGGYPELYAAALSENTGMLQDVREGIAGGLPTLAECGGFLYLHETLEDMEGRAWPMAGVLKAQAYRTPKLMRFGYVKLMADDGRELLRGHEFHYFDSTDNGDALLAKKPAGNRSWRCMHRTEGMLAGFAHLYYYSNPLFALQFAEQCAVYRKRRLQGRA